MPNSTFHPEALFAIPALIILCCIAVFLIVHILAAFGIGKGTPWTEWGGG